MVNILNRTNKKEIKKETKKRHFLHLRNKGSVKIV